MPVMNYGESSYGINIPIGRYTARFLGTEARNGIKDKKTDQVGAPRMAFIWEVVEGQYAGEKIIQETVTVPSFGTECARMLDGLAGRQLTKEKVDTDTFIGRLFSVSVAKNPKSPGGRLHVGYLEPYQGGAGAAPAAPGNWSVTGPTTGTTTAGGPHVAPGAFQTAPEANRPWTPPPRPSAVKAAPQAAQPAGALYITDHPSVPFDQKLDADGVRKLLFSQGMNPADLPLLKEGEPEWKTAADYGFEASPIPT